MDDSRRGDHVEYSACFVRIPLITGGGGLGWCRSGDERSIRIRRAAVTSSVSSPSMENVDAGDEMLAVMRIKKDCRKGVLEISVSFSLYINFLKV